MNAKQYLKKVYRLDDIIKANQEELNCLRELSKSITGVDYSSDKVQSSNSSSDAGFVNTVTKIIELENAINKDIAELFNLKLKIREIINDVEDVDERLLLHHKYLNLYNWDVVCEKMDVSIRTAHRIHASALKNIIVPC